MRTVLETSRVENQDFVTDWVVCCNRRKVTRTRLLEGLAVIRNYQVGATFAILLVWVAAHAVVTVADFAAVATLGTLIRVVVHTGGSNGMSKVIERRVFRQLQGYT